MKVSLGFSVMVGGDGCVYMAFYRGFKVFQTVVEKKGLADEEGAMNFAAVSR